VCGGAGGDPDGHRAVGPGHRGGVADLLPDVDLSVGRPGRDVGGRPGDGDVARRGGEVDGTGHLADPDTAVSAADLPGPGDASGGDGAALALDVEPTRVLEPD